MIKKSRNSIVSNKIARSLVSGNPKSFWEDVKKIKGNSSIIPNSVDNAKGANEISELFADKYKKLYNSVPSILEEQHELMSKLECDCHDKCTHNNDCYDTHKINISHVSMAVKGIKSAKRDGTCNMYTDHLINGSKHLHVHLALMYSSMLSHAFSPIQFCTSTLIAIPKNKRKSLHDSNTYRSIALSNVLSKLLGTIILMKHADKLSSSDLQFGFKQRGSTATCTFVLDEVIKYYNNSKTDV